MKILKLGTYHYPEITAGSHLNDDLYRGIAKADIDLSLYVPMPSRGVSKEARSKYKSRKIEKQYNGRLVVHRFSMIQEGNNLCQKTFKYLLCTVFEYFVGIREKDVDLVFCSSTPPTQGMLSAMVAKRLSVKYKKDIPFVYNLQDIFPDSLEITGLAKRNGILWKIGRKMEDYTYRNADKIIVISEGFKRNIMEKGVPENKIEVISNWIDLEQVYPVKRKENKLIFEFGLNPDKFIVVYAGNFGAAQGADIVLKVANKLKNYKNIQFVIFGGGAYFEDAKKEAQNLNNVFIHELMSQDRISEVYSLGDIALITGKVGTGKAGMPSKTWSIMACNTPIIASFDTDSDLADVIRNSGAGECVEPENIDLLSRAIINSYEMKQHNLQLREYVDKHASKIKCVNNYIRVLNTIANRM